MIIDNSFVVTVRDARAFGGCITGWKSFVELHGYTWRDVVFNGLTAQQLLDTKDAYAIALVEFTRRNRL